MSGFSLLITVLVATSPIIAGSLALFEALTALATRGPWIGPRVVAAESGSSSWRCHDPQLLSP